LSAKIFALKGQYNNSPGQRPGEKERIPKPSAGKVERGYSLVSDGMDLSIENRTREKGNNSILTHMKRILNVQFKSKLFLSLPGLTGRRFGWGFKQNTV